MLEIIESDWKLFKKQLPVWRENFLAKVNKKLADILSDASLNETDRFWKVKGTCDQRAKVLCTCFDDIRRSTVILRLSAMFQNKIITSEDLQAFEDENVKRIEEW